MALDLKQEWAETDPKFRWIMIALGGWGSSWAGWGQSAL